MQKNVVTIKKRNRMISYHLFRFLTTITKSDANVSIISQLEHIKDAKKAIIDQLIQKKVKVE